MQGGDAAAIRAYHEATKHSVARLQQAPHVLDWDNRPLPFKVYPDLDPIPLPRDVARSDRPALDVLLGALPAGPVPALDLAGLARLLYFTAGVLRRVTYPSGEAYYRAAACTGALYHVDCYLVCADLPDLAAGVYHFAPHDFALRRLRAGDHRAVVRAAAANDPAVAGAPVLVAYASTYWRNAWKYRSRAWRHCFWDAGTMLANLLAVAAATDLPAHVVQAFVDRDLDALLDLDPAREGTLGVVALGGGAPPPPPAPTVPPLGLATLPLSAEMVDYPAIRKAQEASSLDDAAALRAARTPVATPAPIGDVLLPAPPGGDGASIESVILRRGSARRFPPGSLAAGELGAVLRAAAAPFATDCPVRPEPYLIVHAVDGVAAGSYVASPDGAALTQLRTGDFRREAGFLDLGQELARDAAVNVYWLVDLEAVLAAQGARGYRTAQLAAAIAGGRAYLAAYALERAATGLTFFDDDVTAFFSPHAAGKSVLFLLALGPRGRRAARG